MSGSLRSRAVRLAVAVVAISTCVAPATASAGVLSSLSAWWPIYEGSGQVVHDISGNGNHGVLGSTPTADANDPTWIQGLFGAALRFDGNDFVRVPASTELAPANLTVSAWVRGTQSPGLARYIVSKGAYFCEQSSYALYTGRDGGLQFYKYDAGGNTLHLSAAIAPADIWDGRWHFVAGTFDGTSAKLFVDGRNLGSAPDAQGGVIYQPPVEDSAMGGYLGSCDLYYTGDLDQVAIFSQALPVDQIWSAIRLLFPKPLS